MDGILSLPFVPQAYRGTGIGVWRLRAGERAVYEWAAGDLCVVARCQARFLRHLRIDDDL